MGQSRGVPLRLLINRRRRNQQKGGDFLGREKDKKREEKFFGEKREASCRNGGRKGKKRKPRGGKILEKEQRTNAREEEGGEQKTEGRVCFWEEWSSGKTEEKRKKILKTDKRSREGQKQRTTLRREGEPQAKQLTQFPYCHQHRELSAAHPW